MPIIMDGILIPEESNMITANGVNIRRVIVDGTVVWFFNRKPTTPELTTTIPESNIVAPGTPVRITAASTDPDGDKITYHWENIPSSGLPVAYNQGQASQNNYYSLGKQLVKVIARDEWGAEAGAAIVFGVSSGNNFGTAQMGEFTTSILEEGVANFSIIYAYMNAPGASGHNSSNKDVGTIWGRKTSDNEWEVWVQGTTSNGITLTATAEPGVYWQAKFVYQVDLGHGS